MSINRNQLLAALDEYLRVGEFSDYCPNGLQVEGKLEVQKIATAVTASEAAIEAARKWGADMLLVHHGYFWKGETQVVTGMKRRRLALLMTADMNLVAYHLPLDYHPSIGNNTQLGILLEPFLPPFEIIMGSGQQPIWRGSFLEPCSVQTFAEGLNRAFNRSCLWIDVGKEWLQTFGWCTGGAQGYIDHAAQLGLDAFISGEISEQTTHSAVEQNIHYFAAGHHATEKGGVQALGAWLAGQFGVQHRFIDIPNPA